MSDQDDKIIYSLIAKHDKPLVEYSNFTGTFNEACLNLLKKIEDNSSKAVKVGDFIIFYLNENGLTFMIMTGKQYPKTTAIGCLQSIKTEFNSTYEGRDFEGELRYGLDSKSEFKEKLRLKFEYFNENKDVADDKIEKLKNEMSKMKDEVVEASGLLNERGKNIEILGEKAETLSRDSGTYYRQSKRVKRAEYMKKIKYYIILAVIVLIIIYIIIGSTCGFGFQCARD